MNGVYRRLSRFKPSIKRLVCFMTATIITAFMFIAMSITNGSAAVETLNPQEP